MSEVREQTEREKAMEKRKEEIKKAIFIHNQLIDQFPEVYKHLKELWRKNGKM
jgi:hypothetical protein